MWIKDTWNRIKKGVKAGMAAIQIKNVIDDDQIVGMITEFQMSIKLQTMLTGDRYYRVKNDILKRKIYKPTKDGTKQEWKYKANNKLAHGKYKNMIDEKINYIFARPFSLTCDDKDYVSKVTEQLGKHFNYLLTGLGYEASNKGIGWLQTYIDKNGKFKMLIIPSEQCIPIWKDNSHMELSSMIRFYNTTYWKGTEKLTNTNVEVWTEEGVTYYLLKDKKLIYNYDKSNDVDNGGPVAHYKVNDTWMSWGKVPFVPFKNNRIEVPDIDFVKTLIDAYDLSRSDVANYIEEVKNVIYVLKGYGGEDLDDFMDNLNKYRAIKIEDVESGAVDAITPKMDIEAMKEHYEQLKRDLTEDGQTINKDLDKFGSAPSGVALKFMYAGLDLKDNALEVEFKQGFEDLLYFINVYLGETNSGNYIQEKMNMEIVFNRDMEINESETITNCSNSKGIISDETILANHPWVKDVAEEQKKIKEQNNPDEDFDTVPTGGNQ